MAEELLVVLSRNENSGFGFSLLGQPGLPPIIYEIVEDSPAAESGEVQVGDVILEVNNTDVNRFSTKEVLKCLRLSSDPVTLKLKRDPVIKACMRRQLLAAADEGTIEFMETVSQTRNKSVLTTVGNHARSELSAASKHHHSSTESTVGTNGSCSELESLLPCDNSYQEDDQFQWQPLSMPDKPNNIKPKFEAYMMTGEHILNLSRTPQSTSLLSKHQKKVDSLRYHSSSSSTTSHHTTTTTQHNKHSSSHHHHHHHHNSVPTSPNETDIGYRLHHQPNKSGANSAGTSPVSANKRDSVPNSGELTKTTSGFTGYVRTSRSEDHLQLQKDSSMSAVDIEIEEDVTSSLNTLLDTRLDSGSTNNVSQTPTSDRIVWTYNAPVSSPSASEPNSCCHVVSNGRSSSHSTTSPSSSLRSTSPASPTSVSSSVMSSRSGSHSHRIPLVSPPISGGGAGGAGELGVTNYHPQPNGDLSVSEAISNMSSPDYHDEETMDILNARDLMEISDHSDSDSTILVSEPHQHRRMKNGSCVSAGSSSSQHATASVQDSEHKIIIQVKGPDKDNATHMVYSPKGMRRSHDTDKMYESAGNTTPELQGYKELRECDDDLAMGLDDDTGPRAYGGKATSPPPSSEDDSDIESLHSFHYSPKAVDIPSAIRLAKRLYSLDGFKKSDVSRHLSKNNDFSKAVAEEYLKYFNFENDTLDVALRKFLKQFSLTGETQERERVLVHFSKRYLDCNLGSFNSQDAVHTLTCAIMLLNTDLHGQNIGRKMTCNEFIDNLAGLNEGENFPREILKHLYQAIKNYPLEWALDEESDECASQSQIKPPDHNSFTSNPFLDIPNTTNAIEYKKGYVMRKCCYEANAKRTPFHKRSWKMYYCTLRDLVLYLHKDEHGFRKNQISDNLHNAIRIHHALATKANDYTKKQYVFRLQTADQAEYLFQTSDPKELQSWIDTINFVCASFSSQPLEGGVGSQKKFQRPLLPCSHTKLNLREQLRDHEERVMRLEAELGEHRKQPPERGAKALVIQNYKEKDAYLNFEVNRYRTYAHLLHSRMSQYPELEPSLTDTCIGEVDEASGIALLEGTAGGIVPPPVPDRRSPPTNR
ncbi:Exchange factor for Arf 6 [Carabus blaptoides fortunei]